MWPHSSSLCEVFSKSNFKKCSSRVLLVALGHTLTPFGFFSGDVHVFQVTFFILGRPGFLLYPFNSHCVAWWCILESSIHMTCPNHLRSLIMSSSFLKPVFFLISSFFTLSFMKFPTICVGTYDVGLLSVSSFFVCVTDSGHRSALYTVTLTKRATLFQLLLPYSP